MEETKGVLLFNKGEKCIVRAIVALYTLREHWDGEVTFFLEDPYPKEFDQVCKYFNVNVVHCDTNNNVKVLVRKTELFVNSPYDRTLWIDSDTIVVGKIKEMFDYLDDCDIAIPHFAGWTSSGGTIAGRIKKYIGICEQKYIDEALKDHPAINTGVVAYRKNLPFMKDWISLAQKGDGKMFIPDEVAFQVLYPSYSGVKIVPKKFNVSVRFGEDVEDKRIIHYHGQKHCLDFNLCNLWKSKFEEMRKNNIANINNFIQYADKRLVKYLDRQHNETLGLNSDVTIVTACDEKYVEILQHTYPNWRKYKNIDKYQVMVFVNGMDLNDERLDFLKLPNVKLIPWKMENAESHREEMLSAFVFGVAENVKTDYWMKLDADSYATNYVPLIDEDMKRYAFCGHKWSYSKVDHIKKLDEWAKKHGQRKLRKAKPMITEGRIDGSRFFHNVGRTISYVQLHKTRFTRFCVKLLSERKLPAPTQDTYMFYIGNRFDPSCVGRKNFKKHYGFTQGNGRAGVDAIKARLQLVEEQDKG
jgi:lipopolysaccharide biosynthesis glycosyltransferase